MRLRRKVYLRGKRKLPVQRRLSTRRLCLEPLEPRQLLAVGLPAGMDLPATPKNVILMIGDGMGFEQVTAGRMFLGGEIVLDEAPYQAEMTTFSANSSITDSAASGTAIATGQKANNGVVSLAIPGDAAELYTSLEVYRDLGKATGLVTTTTITHATPAVFGAHAASRGYTTEIAGDLLNQTRPNVMFGGGGSGMTVGAAVDAGYAVVTDRDAMLAMDADTATFVTGQFGSGHMPYEYDGLGNLPHLSEMTNTALDVLDNDPDGFFLMIEGGRIDHAGHANDIERNVRETVEFANAVELVLDWAAGRADTLIVVTADHECGGMTVVADNGPGVAPDVTWSTSGHTGVNVPVYAWGTGAELVDGLLDNTDIFTIDFGGATPLRPITFRHLQALDPSAGDLWFHAQTTRQGLLTLEAVFDGAPDGAELTLYDDELDELATSTPVGGNQRIDRQTEAAESYYFKLSGTSNDVDLRMANLVRVSQDGSLATVHDSPGDDTFEATPGSSWAVNVNGIAYEFGDATGLELLGGAGGADLATVYDSSGDDEFVGWPNGALMITPGGTCAVDAFETIVGQAGNGGFDKVKFYDSPGDDTFVTVPSYGLLLGDGYSLQGVSFDEVHAFATSGGHDVTRMYDSAGDDTFYATPVETALYGDGFYNRAKFFDEVHSFATAAGHDVAYLHDSPGDDELYATPVEGAIYSPGFLTRAKFFEQLHGDASAGGDDTAYLHDSAGRDTFVATPTFAKLSGTTFSSEVTNFDTVTAYATAGDYDVARLYDSAGDDVFWTTPTFGALLGDAFYNQAEGFEGVNAYVSAGGYDTAKFYDSPSDDTFYGTPGESMIWGPGFYHRAKGFGRVDAFATADGTDIAWLFDSPDDDTFYGTPVESALHGGNYFNRAKYFEQVYGDAGAGGDDSAYLYDSAQIDLLEAENNWARLSNSTLDFLFETTSFDFVEATATTDGDKKDVPLLSLLTFDLSLEGPWV